MGGGNARCIQVDVITKSELEGYKGIGAAICPGYHAQGSAVTAPQQAIAKLIQQRAQDLHVREVVVAAARGRGGAPLPRWRREVRLQQGAQP